MAQSLTSDVTQTIDSGTLRIRLTITTGIPSF
jgi:hypothetical protein